MTAPSQMREIGPTDRAYYVALSKACIHEGSPTVMNWAGAKWTRVKRNGTEIFINSGLQSQMDVAYGGGTIGYTGTADVGAGAPLPQGPGDHPAEGISSGPIQHDITAPAVPHWQLPPEPPTIPFDPEETVVIREPVVPLGEQMLNTLDEMTFRGAALPAEVPEPVPPAEEKPAEVPVPAKPRPVNKRNKIS